MAAIKIMQSKVNSVVKDALVSLPRKEDHSILSQLNDADYLKFQKDIKDISESHKKTRK